jgi:hypothetical protein
MQSQELRDLSKELQDNLSKLIEKRRNWENHWQQVSDYCLSAITTLWLLVQAVF